MVNKALNGTYLMYKPTMTSGYGQTHKLKNTGQVNDLSMDSICIRHPNWCIYIQEVHEMSTKACECPSIKEYDGHFRCMTCFKEYVVATEEDVMNMTQVAPALARIQVLETENTSLILKLAALKAVVKAMKNPVPIETVDSQMSGAWENEQ
jgi:hypothetical protein